ncbi:MAG: zinc ribbon domain-containing protein [Clostridiales bacterium]|nr:zinc ribbon domain-containing protein [Clostridiales bacterium]
MYCAECGKPIKDYAQYCGSCGKTVDTGLKSCGVCGFQSPKGASYCLNCGTKFSRKNKKGKILPGTESYPVTIQYHKAVYDFLTAFAAQNPIGGCVCGCGGADQGLLGQGQAEYSEYSDANGQAVYSPNEAGQPAYGYSQTPYQQPNGYIQPYQQYPQYPQYPTVQYPQYPMMYPQYPAYPPYGYAPAPIPYYPQPYGYGYAPQQYGYAPQPAYGGYGAPQYGYAQQPAYGYPQQGAYGYPQQQPVLLNGGAAGTASTAILKSGGMYIPCREKALAELREHNAAEHSGDKKKKDKKNRK